MALLVFSTSGAMSLLVQEPCSSIVPDGKDDAACPPTCVTCGCCAQAIEPMTLTVSVVPELMGWDVPPVQPSRALSTSFDILHVPKRARA